KLVVQIAICSDEPLVVFRLGNMAVADHTVNVFPTAFEPGSIGDIFRDGGGTLCREHRSLLRQPPEFGIAPERLPLHQSPDTDNKCHPNVPRFRAAAPANPGAGTRRAGKRWK